MECAGHLAHDGEKERWRGERERDGDEGRGRGVEGKEEGTYYCIEKGHSEVGVNWFGE